MSSVDKYRARKPNLKRSLEMSTMINKSKTDKLFQMKKSKYITYGILLGVIIVYVLGWLALGYTNFAEENFPKVKTFGILVQLITSTLLIFAMLYAFTKKYEADDAMLDAALTNTTVHSFGPE